MSSDPVLADLFEKEQRQLGVCPCKQDVITANHVVRCLDCLEKELKIKLSQFGRNIGFAIPPVPVSMFEVNLDDVIVEDDKIVALAYDSDLCNKWKKCEIVCLQKGCGRKIDFSSLLYADRVLLRSIGCMPPH